MLTNMNQFRPFGTLLTNQQIFGPYRPNLCKLEPIWFYLEATFSHLDFFEYMGTPFNQFDPVRSIGTHLDHSGQSWTNRHIFGHNSFICNNKSNFFHHCIPNLKNIELARINWDNISLLQTNTPYSTNQDQY